jgi:putative ABC transport system ATP-binding protein
MIKLVNVTKEYNLDEQIITPVSDMSFDINQGEFIIIVGRSGTGKSTVLNLIAGLIKPTSGQVLLDDSNIHSLSDRELSIIRSQKMGYIFQFPSLLPSLDILENVLMPCSMVKAGINHKKTERAEELLKMLGLGERMESYPRNLSAGEYKRAVIARALINEPEILLADEPTSDLDEQTEHEIMHLLKEIHLKGVTIVMVTHSISLMPYADRAFNMADGKLAIIKKA